MARKKPPTKPYIGQPYIRKVSDGKGGTKTVYDVRIKSSNGQIVYTTVVQGYNNHEDAMTPLLHLQRVPLVVKDVDGNVIPPDADMIQARKRGWFARMFGR